MTEKKRKNINEQKEEWERKRKMFIKQMEYIKNKRGITKTRDDYDETKGRKYVRDINEYYKIVSPEKKLYITEGTKREGVKHCYSKSQMAYYRERLEREGKITPEIIEVARLTPKTSRLISEKIIMIEPQLLPRRKEKVFLIEKNMVIVAEIEISPSEHQFMTQYRGIVIKIERTLPELDEIYNTRYGEMNGENIIRVMLATGMKMYEII